jgi:hypothetical protein
MLDQPAIAAAGLEHVRQPARAAALDVQNDAHFAREILVGEECLRAEEAGLFAVGDQEEQRIAMPLAARGARDLEQRGDPGAVVRGARSGADGVVMGHQYDGIGAPRVRRAGDDVLDHRTDRQGIAGEAALDRRLVSECVETRRDPVANARVRGGGDRMRHLLGQQIAQHGRRARGRELPRRRAFRLRRRTSPAPQNERENDQQGEGDRQDTTHGSAFSRNSPAPSPYHVTQMEARS